MQISFDNIDVAILCGGLGTRLKSILKECPKVMAKMNGRPFLEILIDYYKSNGFKRFILCTGYKAEIIQHYFQGKHKGDEVVISQEKEPLGTGGAIKKALSKITSNPFIVVNGDSFLKVDFLELLEFHNKSNALTTIALVKLKDTRRYGRVNVDSTGKILNFDEKIQSKKDGWINGGVYILNKEIFEKFDKHRRSFSLEYDLFPRLVGLDFYGMKTNGEEFIDIGTPDDFLKANEIIAKALR